MILQQIIKQIKQVYPLYDNTFSNLNPVINYSYLNNKLTFVTKFPHGLKVNDFAITDGVKAAFLIKVDSYDPTTGIMIIELSSNNQLLFSDTTIELKGFKQLEFNGIFPLLNLGSTKATVQLPLNLQLDSSDTEKKYALKKLANYINAYKKVISIPDDFTYMVNESDFINESELDLTNACLKTSRVAGVVDFKWGLENKKETLNRPWLWVTLDSTHIERAFFGSSTVFNYNTQRVDVTDVISVYAIYPLETMVTAYEAVDILRGIVYFALLKCIANTWVPTVNVWEDGVLKQDEGSLLAIGDIGMFSVDSSRLIYKYNFNYASQITDKDGFDLFDERPLKTFEIDVNDYWIEKGKVPTS